MISCFLQTLLRTSNTEARDGWANSFLPLEDIRFARLLSEGLGFNLSRVYLEIINESWCGQLIEQAENCQKKREGKRWNIEKGFVCKFYNQITLIDSEGEV